jgi:hypothetical protein
MKLNSYIFRSSSSVLRSDRAGTSLLALQSPSNTKTSKNQLRAALKMKLKDGPQEVNILDWITRTALELIGQSGMDYSFDNLVDEENSHPYAESLKQFVYVTSHLKHMSLRLHC